MNVRVAILLLVAGLAALAGCAFSGEQYRWSFVGPVVEESAPKIKFSVTRRQGAGLVWTVDAGAYLERRERQRWKARRADLYAGVQQHSHEWEVLVPALPGDPISKDGGPSAKDLPAADAKAHPEAPVSQVPAPGLKVECQWEVNYFGNGHNQPKPDVRGSFFGSGEIELSAAHRERIVERLLSDPSRSARLVITARPIDWGGGDVAPTRSEIRLKRTDLEPASSQGPAEPAPKPPAKGTAAKKGTTQARPPRTGGGSGQP